MLIGLLPRALRLSHHLPLAWAVSRSNRKRLDDILSVIIMNGIVQPPFRNEHMSVTKVLCRPVGAVVVDRDNGLEIKPFSIGKNSLKKWWFRPHSRGNPIPADLGSFTVRNEPREAIGNRHVDSQSLLHPSLKIG